MRAGVIVGLLLAGCTRTPRPDAAPSPAAPRLVPLIATAELHGTTEPCGCNSDPLGDLARLVAQAQGGLLLDAGNQLYDDKPADAHRAQADRKADLIGRVWEKAGGEAAIGANDLLGGLDRLRPPRQACNLTLPSGIAAPRVHEVGGLKVGVFGVSGKDVPKAVLPAVESAKKAIAALEAQHAEIIVALLAMPRMEARELLKGAPGVDFAVFGVGVEEGMPEPEPVGRAWLVAPADQGRRAARFDVFRGSTAAGARVWPERWDGESGRARSLARLDKRKAALAEQLKAFAADKSADASFVAARKQELDEVTAEREKVAADKPVPPAGAYFTYTLQPIRRVLPRDAAVAAALQELARDNGRANLEAAQKEAAPPAEKGKPSYAGIGTCGKCHKPAVAFWEKTHHASAWKTLVDVDKQYDYDCIGCHVTGWQEPGGAHLASVEKKGLVNVQCEVCHGPGSTHVEEAGMETPKSLKMPAADLCATRCHTKEHSDTFALDPYLRDILGPGHGEARRKALGDGPTGHELREKALAAAGR
jgi:hypothetical protein